MLLSIRLCATRDHKLEVSGLVMHGLGLESGMGLEIL